MASDLERWLSFVRMSLHTHSSVCKNPQALNHFVQSRLDSDAAHNDNLTLALMKSFSGNRMLLSRGPVALRSALSNALGVHEIDLSIR